MYLTPDRSVHRKLRETLITWRLEQSLDKRRILELYLNVVEWGDGVWGAQQASRFYFGKSPSQLTAFEGAVLASLLPAPRVPLHGRNRERALYVQRRVLRQLRASGVIDQAQYSESVMRIALLAKALADGRTLRDAVGEAATTSIAPAGIVAEVADPIAASGALALECGRERRVRVGAHP